MSDPHAESDAPSLPSERPIEIGLTGSIGAGKSTVAAALARRGAAVIDADALARRAVREPAILAAVAERLGDELVQNGELDRAATAERVFGDPEARAALDAIVHPRVAELRAARVREFRAASDPPPVIVHDVPLLFEAGLEDTVDLSVVVVAPLEQRIRRVTARSGLGPAEVRRRDASQMPQEAKAARADVVIDNGGDEADLEARVAQLWTGLVER